MPKDEGLGGVGMGVTFQSTIGNLGSFVSSPRRIRRANVAKKTDFSTFCCRDWR